MNPKTFDLRPAVLALATCLTLSGLAQTPDNPPRRDGDRPPVREGSPREGRPNFQGQPPDGPGGPGRGGFGGVQQKTKLVKQFDKNGDGRLDIAERKAAREFLAQERAEGRGPRGFGGRGGRGGAGGAGFGRGGGNRETANARA